MLKSIGDKPQPCLNPLFMVRGSEKFTSVNFIEIFVSLYKLCIALISWGGILSERETDRD
jgi:hypothetical protein